MEDTSYAYLHCDLLDNTPLMTITFKVKSPHMKMHEQYLQNGMFVRDNFSIDSKSKIRFEKGDMHVVITMNQRPLCHQSLFLNMS
jgi:copper(I)-binding protein